MIDNDYKNFAERMGSFEECVAISNIVTRNRSVIEHAGIMGMKWGKHKIATAGTIGAAAKTGQSAASLGQTITKNAHSKKSLNEAKKLNDDDLKQLTNRLNLENNYINAQTQQAGKNKVESILSTVGATMAFVSSAAVMVDVIRKAKG